jgi:uncharacterized protein YerC
MMGMGQPPSISAHVGESTVTMSRLRAVLLYFGDDYSN